MSEVLERTCSRLKRAFFISKSHKIGFLEASSIGIGGMVGADIFADRGLVVVMSRGGTVVAFTIAGVVALPTAYDYAKLSVALPSQAGSGRSYLAHCYPYARQVVGADRLASAFFRG